MPIIDQQVKEGLIIKKLPPEQCYNILFNSMDMYLTKNDYENYSPQMVPVTQILGPGSWTISDIYFNHVVLAWRKNLFI